MTTPTERLKEMLARAEAATPGPWSTDGDTPSYDEGWDQYASTWVITPKEEWRGGGCSTGGSMCQQMNDAEFIAASRTEHPMLCTLLIQAIEMANRYQHIELAAYEDCIRRPNPAFAFLSEVERALGG